MHTDAQECNKNAYGEKPHHFREKNPLHPWEYRVSRTRTLHEVSAHAIQTGADAPPSQSVSQLFHGPAPRSPLHRLAVRLRHSRSNTSTEYSLPGATQFTIVASEVNLSQRTGCSLPLFALYCLLGRDCDAPPTSGSRHATRPRGVFPSHPILIAPPCSRDS